MAALPLPSSFKLHANNNNQLLCICSATLTANPPTYKPKFFLRQRVTNNNVHPFSNTFPQDQDHLKSLKTRPRTLVADRVLIKEDKQLKIKIEDEACWEKEAANVIMRLKVAVERVRAMEIQKFMSRVKGEVSDCERIAAEEMSREIVCKFLEKPVQYLISDNGHFKLEEKFKDVEILVAILEKSCPANQR